MLIGGMILSILSGMINVWISIQVTGQIESLSGVIITAKIKYIYIIKIHI